LGISIGLSMSFLIVTNKFSDPDIIFKSFVNITSSDGTGSNFNNWYVVLLGLLITPNNCGGYACAGHLIEESKEARSSSVWGFIIAYLVSAINGLLFIIFLFLAYGGDDAKTSI
jgi:hypothetical protein